MWHKPHQSEPYLVVLVVAETGCCLSSRLDVTTGPMSWYCGYALARSPVNESTTLALCGAWQSVQVRLPPSPENVNVESLPSLAPPGMVVIVPGFVSITRCAAATVTAGIRAARTP